MSDTIQSSTYKLHIVGPVNIGTTDSLSQSEYMYNYDAGQVYLLNQREWFKYLYTHKAVPSFEQYLIEELARPNGRSMYTWAVDTLGKYNVTIDTLGTAISSVIIANQNVTNGKNSLNTIIPHIRSGNGDVYIPGSSIKGMIDTAIIEHIIANDVEFRRKLQDELKSHRSIQRSISERIECLKATNGKALKGAFGSVFKGILVSDAMSSDDIKTEVLQKIDHSVKPNIMKEHAVWREYVLPGNAFSFSIKIDTSITKFIGIHCLEDLLRIIEESQQRTRKLLQVAFKQIPKSVWINGEDSNAYLGANTGFIHKTIIMAIFEDNPAEGYQIIKNILNRQFRNHKHFNDHIISPRMLKLTRWRDELWEVGGVRIEPVN